MTALEAASAPGVRLRSSSQGPALGSVRLLALDAERTWRELWSWYVPHAEAAVIADRLEEQGRTAEAAEVRRAWRHAAGLEWAG